MTNMTIIVSSILFALLSIVYYFKGFWPFPEQDLSYPDLPDVKLDLNRMMGRWYSIAHKPNLIESNCRCGRTTDTLVEPLKIQLSESCLFMGRNVTSRSWALPEAEDSGRWTNVQDIVGPIKIKADYWIIELDEDYEWVCIGNPKRSGFWILAREKQIDDSLYNYLLTQAVELGFDISNIEKEDNTDCPN